MHETGTDSSGTLHQAAEEAVARERARMARELHDGLATELAGAISLFKVYLEGHKNDREQPLLDVFGILERMLKQVRDTLWVQDVIRAYDAFFQGDRAHAVRCARREAMTADARTR